MSRARYLFFFVSFVIFSIINWNAIGPAFSIPFIFLAGWDLHGLLKPESDVRLNRTLYFYFYA